MSVAWSLVTGVDAGCTRSPTSPSPTSPSETTYVLSGTVRDAVTRDPLAGAAVQLTTRTGTSTTETAADGRFTFPGVQGSVTLTIRRADYDPLTKSFDVTASASLELLMERTQAVPAACGVGPGSGERTVPLFSRPFAGDFLLTNYFDHDLPLGNYSGDGSQLTFCDERVAGRIGGHQGYDWLLPTGTALLAVAEGQVISAGTDPPFNCVPLGRTVTDQQFVEIRHPVTDGELVSSVFVHLSRIDVQVGQSVSRGQVIGLSGNSGCSTEPHLHMQVWRLTNTKSGRPTVVDPYGWRGAGPDPWAQHPSGSSSIWLWRPGEAPTLLLR